MMDKTKAIPVLEGSPFFMYTRFVLRIGSEGEENRQAKMVNTVALLSYANLF
jgi:hypothetical protein